MTTRADRPAIDLLDGRLYAQGSHPTYGWMREHEPVYFDDKNGVLERIPDLELAGGDGLPRREANFISGLESMPVRFAPSRPVATA